RPGATTGDATIRNFPLGVIFMPSGERPRANGDPGIAVRAPFAAMLYTLALLEVEFAAIRYLPSGVAARDIPFIPDPPVAKGDPGTDVSTPVAGFIENALTLLLVLLATYR